MRGAAPCATYGYVHTADHTPCPHACRDRAVWTDRPADYPTDAINSCSNVPDMGASVSFSGCLIDNLDSLAAENMDGYAPGWNDTYAKCACRCLWGAGGWRMRRRLTAHRARVARVHTHTQPAT